MSVVYPVQDTCCISYLFFINRQDSFTYVLLPYHKTSEIGMRSAENPRQLLVLLWLTGRITTVLQAR